MANPFRDNPDPINTGDVRRLRFPRAAELPPRPTYIVVELKQQYGQQVIVPDCDTGRAFAELCGTKMLTPRAIEIIKALGYEVRVKQTLPTTL